MPYPEILFDEKGNPIPIYYDGTAWQAWGGNITVPEYGWVDGDPEPTPTGFAFATVVDPVAKTTGRKFWDGTAWDDLV